MADNTTLNTGTGGDVIATDDIGGIKHQRVKVQWGTDGTATDVQDTAAASLPVRLRSESTNSDSSTTPLAGGGSWTSTSFDTVTEGALLTSFLFSDQAGTHYYEESVDNSTWDVIHATPTEASVPHLDSFIVRARYGRFRHVNGGTPQTVFRTQAIQRHGLASDLISIDERANAVVGDKEHNTSTPSLTAFEVLTARAASSAPTYSDGNVVLPRVTLSGDTAITLDGETVVVSATDLDIRNLSSATDTVGALQATASNFNAQVVGEIAHDAADSGNPLSLGGIARTALTSVAALDRVKAIFDLQGRQIIRSNVPRGLRIKNTITLTSTTETTLLAAAASAFHDITKIIISNTSATAVRVDFRDTTTGTVLFSIYAPAGQTVGFTDSNDPIEQTTVNTNWTAQLSAGVTDVRIFAQAVKNIA